MTAHPARYRARRPAGLLVAAAVLAGGAVTWAAVPVHGAGRGARFALIAAVICAVASVAQLAGRMLASRPVAASHPEELYVPPAIGHLRQARTSFLTVPWPQGMTIAAIVLEALHPGRAWHTAVLGAVLLAWLLILHLAESGARPSALRPQLPLILAGLGLAALSAAAALLPAAGAGSQWLVAIAAVAAIVVAALALPV